MDGSATRMTGDDDVYVWLSDMFHFSSFRGVWHLSGAGDKISTTLSRVHDLIFFFFLLFTL